MQTAVLSPEYVCERLGSGGFRFNPDEVRVEAREDCWLAHLPNERIAWLAVSDEGRRRLSLERRVLKLIEAKCSFHAPRVLYESDDGALDVRTKVPGLADPAHFYHVMRHEPALAAKAGEVIGAILVEQHTRIRREDVEGWLPTVGAWPMQPDVIRDRVRQVTGDLAFIADIERTLALYESLNVDEADRVLVHNDLGLHNLAFDPDTLMVRGIFDYGEAAWVDRHYDFRYLVFDPDRLEMLDAARAVYESATGVRLSLQRIFLYNAMSAFSYLAYRLGVDPNERFCGRTLAEDIGWSHWAIGRVHHALMREQATGG